MLETAAKAGLITCPVCRGPDAQGVYQHPRLDIAEICAQNNDGHVIQGMLQCTRCPARFPVIDGVAVVFKDVGAWLRQQERALMWRDDLHPHLDDWVRGAWADHEAQNWDRQMLAVYARPLCGQIDEADHLPGPIRALEQDWYRFHEGRRAVCLQSRADAWVLDAGCALGVGALDASRHAAGVIAMDSSFAPLRTLATLLREGRARVPRWRNGGRDYTTVEITLPEGVHAERIVPIAGDVLDPPLAAGRMSLVSALNVLDNTSDPVLAVRQLHAALQPGGTLAMSSPFDWAEHTTPRDRRLGETLRAAGSDAPEDALKALLSGAFETLAPELKMHLLHTAELSWVLPRHRRNAHVFASFYVEAQKPLTQATSA